MLLDIGVGILLSIWIHWFFGTALTPWLVGLGIICVLLPDIDFWIEFAAHGSVGGKQIREHRAVSHFPITYIPVVMGIYYVWGSMWAVFFGVGVLAHFIHDSVGIGWGIMWLWPFSSKAFKCFSEKNGDFSRRFLIAWDPEELIEVAAHHGHPDWFRYIYLRPHPINIIETSFFVMSIIILYLYAH